MRYFCICAIFACVLIRGYEGVRENKVADVILKFYNGNTMSQFVDEYLPTSTNLLNAPGFDKTRPTVFYIHGFTENLETESVQVIISTYLETTPGSNIILVEWTNMGGGNYITNAAPNTKVVAVAVAAEIKNMVNAGLNLPGIHCVGHSLGGQMCGFIGRTLQGYNMNLTRITSLDPAGPLFYPEILLGHIVATDALCVDVIHGDAGNFGAPVHTGSADFWPNRGYALQPGCPVAVPFTFDARCSHSRTWRFWCESLRNPYAFPSVPYASWTEFMFLSYKKNKPINYLGINTNCSLTGDFFLQTKSSSPFSKGINGTVFTL